jgi:site-specific recombinase XerD
MNVCKFLFNDTDKEVFTMDLVPSEHASLASSVQDALGQLSPRSRRIYGHDAKYFAEWIIEHEKTVSNLTRSDMIAYRQHLADTYEPATASRMLSVARRILHEQVQSGNLSVNPAQGIKGFTLGSETPHTALTKQQAQQLLASIDRDTLLGMRDYALISLLLRTGLRRIECAELLLADLEMEQGHRIATVKHGKGDKRRIVKVPVDVYRSIEDYLASAGRDISNASESVFTGVNRWGQSTSKGISDKQIERIVKGYGEKISADLTPHGLRASFITLAIEGGATLLQAQYAAGHSDPRTTERYQKRKINLDDNATDYIKL